MDRSQGILRRASLFFSQYGSRRGKPVGRYGQAGRALAHKKYLCCHAHEPDRLRFTPLEVGSILRCRRHLGSGVGGRKRS
jgi:hypothetical protein